jgi:hypothetical protein
MAEVPRYPRQYRVHYAVFSLFLMQAVTSVIETLGNRKSGGRKGKTFYHKRHEGTQTKEELFGRR